MTKKELRAAMRRRNLGMDAAERAEASRRIFGRGVGAYFRPGGAFGGFRQGPHGGCFLFAGRRAGHVGGAGAVVCGRSSAGCAARRGRRDAVL